MAKEDDSTNFGGRIPADLAKAVRVLAAKQDKAIQEILTEALRDVLKKHGEKIARG